MSRFLLLLLGVSFCLFVWLGFLCFSRVKNSRVYEALCAQVSLFHSGVCFVPLETFAGKRNIIHASSIMNTAIQAISTSLLNKNTLRFLFSFTLAATKSLN